MGEHDRVTRDIICNMRADCADRFGRLDEILPRLEKKLDKVDEKLDTVKVTISGNGDPEHGLVMRIVTLESIAKKSSSNAKTRGDRIWDILKGVALILVGFALGFCR